MVDRSRMTDEQQGQGDIGGEEGELSFIQFVLSLAHTAAVHFGDIPDPATGQTHPPNLAAANQMIGIIALLEAKTRGNLSAEERQFLEQILFELRMRYVEASKPQSRIITP